MGKWSSLRCVECQSPRLVEDATSLRCSECATSFPIESGIVRMVPRSSPLRHLSRKEEAPLALDDTLQAKFWEDDTHGFRPATHPIVSYFSRQRWDYLDKKIDLDCCQNALDVGCGDGFSTSYAPSHIEMTACDGSMTMLQRHGGNRLLQADAFSLPFQDESFDLVFAWELLHHVSEPHRVIAEMARVSKKWVLFLEPNPWNPAQRLFANLDPAHRWVLNFTPGYVRSQVQMAGLKLVHHSIGGWIFPNRTPRWMFHLVKHLPYRLPFLGISHVVIGKKNRAGQNAEQRTLRKAA